MDRFCLSCLCLIFALSARAGKITGRVTDEKGAVLPYASILVKGTTKGTTSNNQGRYFLDLEPGAYTIICQYVGYTRSEKKVTVSDETVVLDFSLLPQQTFMKEVIVHPGGEDPAYAIIRHAIKKRKDYENPLDSFTCEAYIKTLIKTRKLPSQIFGRTIQPSDRRQMGVDSDGRGIIYLSESLTKIAFKKPDKIKLEVISGRESGTGGFGFSFPTFINFYNNNVNVFITQLNPRGFVSPIANGALNYYRYKYLGSFFEEGKEINKIQVIPRRKYEPLFTGTINITEGDWRIHSLDLYLVKEYGLEIIDTLSIKQIQFPVSPTVWATKDQIMYFDFNRFGIDANGTFLNVFNKYDIAPSFRKKYFNNVLVKYDTAVNKKSKAYWDSLRPVQLEPEELKDYHVKDSAYQLQRDSGGSRSMRDSLRRMQGKISAGNILLAGFNRDNFNPKHPFTLIWPGLINSISYNTVEGIAIDQSVGFQFGFPVSRSRLTLTPDLRYGFGNTHFNPSLKLVYSHREFSWGEDGGSSNRSTWTFAGGKRVSQFNPANPISPLLNSLYTLFYHENYMKIYENQFGEIKYSDRMDIGLRFSGDLLYENRNPLNNISNYSIFFRTLIVSTQKEGWLS